LHGEYGGQQKKLLRGGREAERGGERRDEKRERRSGDCMTQQ
jgi:hypothetical protein